MPIRFPDSVVKRSGHLGRLKVLRRVLHMPKLDYDVCARCGSLFDDQGENGWWIREGLWWHECDNRRPARIVVRKLELKKTATAA